MGLQYPTLLLRLGAGVDLIPWFLGLTSILICPGNCGAAPVDSDLSLVKETLQTFGSDPSNKPTSVESFSGHKEPLGSWVLLFGRRKQGKTEYGILVQK